jgi:hypothetical protein
MRVGAVARAITLAGKAVAGAIARSSATLQLQNHQHEAWELFDLAVEEPHTGSRLGVACEILRWEP